MTTMTKSESQNSLLEDYTVNGLFDEMAYVHPGMYFCISTRRILRGRPTAAGG